MKEVRNEDISRAENGRLMVVFGGNKYWVPFPGNPRNLVLAGGALDDT